MPVKRVNGTGGTSAIGVSKTQVESTDKSAPPSSVTLSGLLNAIDGVASQVGLVIMHTANMTGRLGVICIYQFPRKSRCGPTTTWTI
jgi:hypothetical protein